MLNKYKCRTFLVLMMLALLSACGGQDAKLSSNASSKTGSAGTLNNASQTTVQTHTPLLANLAKQFPDGKFPSDKLEAAAKQLAQSPRILKASSTTSTASKQMPAARSTQSLTNNASGYIPIYRYIQSDLYGTYFLSKHEMLGNTTAQSIDPNYLPQGAVFEVEQSYRAGLSAVYRFRNKANNTHVDIIDPAERDYIISDLSAYYAYENIHWYASVYSYSGLKPVYRFWNKVNGTYLFTADQNEINTISSSYSEIFDDDGIVFYVRSLSPDISPTFASIYPKVATQNAKTDFVVRGQNLPLDAQLSFDTLNCETPTHRTATGFSQKCMMGSGTAIVGRVVANSGTKQLAYSQIDLSPAIVESIYTGNLQDSGTSVDHCYGAGSDVLISCTSAAAIALNAKQDGMTGRDLTAPAAADGKLGFSFSNVVKPTGGTYAKTECVKDNITGLMWEGKTSSGLRNISNTYTNYDSISKLQKWDGVSYVSPSLADINAVTNTVGYQNYVNSIALCGYSNWRLPTSSELLGLIDFGNSTGRPYIDANWFVNSDISTAEVFWSSSASNHGESEAWFNTDVFYRSGPRDISRNVRLVRDTTVNSQVRFSFINGGTEVMDQKTKLIWRRCSEGAVWDGSECIENGLPSTFTVESALIQARGQAGWRLPNIKELNSIVDLGTLPAIDQTIFSIGAGFGQNYITSTPFVGGLAMSFYIDSDGSNAYYFFNSNDGQYRARLVRNAP